MLRVVLAAGAIGLVLMAVLIALSLVPADAGAAQVRAAFADGELVRDASFLNGNTRIGAHQYNDCLILIQALNGPEISPRTLIGEPCDQLYRLAHDLPTGAPIHYHRYIHGHTPLVRLLLPVLSVEQIRALLQLTLAGLLVAGLALSVRRRDPMWSAIFAAFLGFFGILQFGQSFNHGPAGIVLAAYMLYLASGRPNRVAASAIFGALTLMFEFLSGGLPLGLAIIVGTLKREELWPCLVAFATAAGTAIAVRVGAVAVAYGWADVAGMITAFSGRLVEAPVRPLDLPYAIAANLGAMGYRPLVAATLLAAVVAGTLGIIRTKRWRLALSNLVLVAWTAVFWKHMVLHAGFMDRIFVWTIASGFALLALALGQRYGQKAPVEA